MTTMLSYHPDRAVDTDKHLYELSPDENPVGWMLGGRSKRENHGREAAITRAASFLAENPEVGFLRLYHTYPSPGPVRRFVGRITREHGLRTPA
jgi:hypothetical protein